MLSPSLAQRAEVLPDPTLCNNLITTGSNDDALKTRLQEMGVDFSRERIGIVSPDNSAVIEMADHFRKRGSQIIGITTQNSFCDINLFQEGLSPSGMGKIVPLYGFLRSGQNACDDLQFN